MSMITGIPWLLAHKSMLEVNKPQKISLYNRDYVIWKDRQDKVSILPNACPHLGGMLSEGWCEEHPDHSSSIACPYHGLQFDSNGCTVLPGTKKTTLPLLKPPELIIQGDLIWSYGDYEPKMPIPTALQELAASHDFIGYSADTSVEIDLRTMLLNMHDYNHQTGAHHEPMKIREVQLEQFVDEGHKSHALFHSVLQPKSLTEKLKNPSLFLLPQFVTTHLENFFPNLVVLHADNQFGKVAQCHIFVPETDIRTRIYVLIFAQPKISLMKNLAKKFILDLAKTVIEQDVDVLQKVYPHSSQKIRLNNEVGMNWIDRNFDNFPAVVPPNYSMRSQPPFDHDVANKPPFVANKQLLESNHLANSDVAPEIEKSLI